MADLKHGRGKKPKAKKKSIKKGTLGKGMAQNAINAKKKRKKQLEAALAGKFSNKPKKKGKK